MSDAIGKRAQALADDLSNLIFEAIRLKPRPKEDPEESKFALGWERAIHTACLVVRDCLDNPPPAITTALLAAVEEERAACEAIAKAKGCEDFAFGWAFAAEHIANAIASRSRKEAPAGGAGQEEGRVHE